MYISRQNGYRIHNERIFRTTSSSSAALIFLVNYCQIPFTPQQIQNIRLVLYVNDDDDSYKCLLKIKAQIQTGKGLLCSSFSETIIKAKQICIFI